MDCYKIWTMFAESNYLLSYEQNFPINGFNLQFNDI